MAMAVSFTGCDLIEWLTCVQFGECAQIGDIKPVTYDGTVPDAPTNFAAVPGDGRITFTWTPSTADDVAKYEVAYSTQSGGDPPAGQRTHLTEVAGKATSSATVTGLQNGQTLHYVVYSHDTSGNRSGPSNEVAAAPVGGAPGGGLAALFQIGGPGEGPGQFNRPSGVAVSRTGDVYVTDKQHYRVQRFGPTGDFRGGFGNFGSAEGEFQFPHGIAVDVTGAVYVTDLVRNDVQKFDSEGNFIWVRDFAGAPYNQPLDPLNIAAGLENTVYVTDNSNYVYRFSSNGQVVSRFGSGPFGSREPGNLDGPDGIGTDPAGNVYVTQESADRVEKFAADGTFLGSFGGPGTGDGQFGSSRGITHSPIGDVFLTDGAGHRVQEFTVDGAYVSQFGSRGSTNSQFEFPVAIASDCRGRLYVVDEGNNRVLVFGDPTTGPPPCNAGPGPPKAVPGTSAPSALVLESAAGKFRATLSTTRITRGKLSQSGARVDEKGIVARGRFGGRLGSRRRGLSMLAPYTGGGTWRTRFDVRADLVKRGGTARGYTLATARRKRGGRVCLKFSTKFAVVGQRVSVTGTFRAVGGTGAGAKLVASGRFKQTYRANRSSTMTGSGKASNGRARKMPAACRRLARGR